MIKAHSLPRRPIAAIVAALFGISAHPVAATTWSVTTCIDETASHAGSLRYVLSKVQSGDEVDFSSLSCSVITLAYGPMIDDVDTITFSGPANRVLTIDGGHADRVLVHNGHGAVTVRQLTFSHGHYAKGIYGGGCIYAYGDVVLDHAVVSDCDVQAPSSYGGGIYTRGGVTLKYSTVTGNSAYHQAGGIFVAGYLLAIASTISKNSAGFAGGVGALANATFVASTLYGNTAGEASALALLNHGSGTARIVSSTITGNATNRAEIIGVIEFDNVTLYNSTVAANTYLGNFGHTIYTGALGTGTVTTISSIIAGDFGGNGGSGHKDIYSGKIVGNSNIIGSSNVALPGDTITKDPQLLPLAGNGGPTRTLGLKSTSPAIDAGDNPLGASNDQRGAGFPRVIGKAPDIGAFEYNDNIFASGFEP